MGENVGKGLLLEEEPLCEETPGNPETDKKKPLELISFGNTEIDRRLDGGIPVGSLCLLEGANDSGKSIFMQQVMWGALNQDKRVLVLTTEKTSRGLLNDMENLKQDVSDYFIIGRSRIFEIKASKIEENPELGETLLQTLLECIKECEEEIILIDSLTIFAVITSENSLLNFFTECVKLCDNGKTVFISVHGYAFPQEVLLRLRSVCDSCLELRIEQVGDKWIKTMEVQKLRGARKTTGNMLSFDVNRECGLKIIPVSKVKA